MIIDNRKVSITIDGLEDSYSVAMMTRNQRALFVQIRCWLKLTDYDIDYKAFFQRLQIQLRNYTHGLFGERTIFEQSVTLWDGKRKNGRKCYQVELAFLLPEPEPKIDKLIEKYKGKIEAFTHFLNTKLQAGHMQITSARKK